MGQPCVGRPRIGLGGSDLKPQLAANRKSSDDGKTCTLHLRESVELKIVRGHLEAGECHNAEWGHPTAGLLVDTSAALLY